MLLHSWLRNLRSTFTPGRELRHDKRQGSLRATRHRPNLEVLEDRLTPSFYLAGSQPGAGWWEPTPPPLADFTSDGILDRISGNYPGLAVEPGLGDGTFAEPIVTNVMGADPLAVADFNGDGRLDVFTSEWGWEGGGNVYLYLGRGDGTFKFSEGFVLSTVSPTSMAPLDLNQDGYPDLAIAGYDYYAYQEALEFLLNDGEWAPLPLALRIGDRTVTEGNSGAASATFTVTLSAASTETITVAYASGWGNATVGSDYQATSGTLTFAPGETSKTITVPVIGDRLGEPNETFLVRLSNPTNATIDDGDGWGTILDDEPRISISDVSKSEGRKGQTTRFTFTVTLSAAYDEPVTMSFRTVNGTATTANGDYVAKTGTLTFAPGETTKTITITVKGDSKREGNETFYLDLSGLSSNGLFTKSRGVGTILNDD